MTFTCAICGAVAGTLRIQAGQLRRESFTGALLRPAPAAPLAAWLDSIRCVCPEGHERMLGDR